MRWFARLGMNEGIANHVSVAQGRGCLINPAGRHWALLFQTSLANSWPVSSHRRCRLRRIHQSK
ncbi:MAG: hypothetical protein AAF194_09585 [Pseudomonadota bacterium]